MTSQCTKRWLASFIFERKLQCICWRKLPDLEASEMICTINLKQHCVKQRIGSLLFFMVCLFVCYVCLFVWSFSGSVVGNPLSGFFVLLYLFALVCLTFVCLFFVLIFFRVCCWQSTLQVCPLFARIAIAQNVYASGFVGRGWIYRNRKDDERSRRRIDKNRWK